MYKPNLPWCLQWHRRRLTKRRMRRKRRGPHPVRTTHCPARRRIVQSVPQCLGRAATPATGLREWRRWSSQVMGAGQTRSGVWKKQPAVPRTAAAVAPNYPAHLPLTTESGLKGIREGMGGGCGSCGLILWGRRYIVLYLKLSRLLHILFIAGRRSCLAAVVCCHVCWYSLECLLNVCL